MRFSKPIFALVTAASILASNAAMARDLKLCAQYDASERKMTINTSAGCISSSIGFPYRDVTAQVHADTATIIVTSKKKTAKPRGAHRIVTADCMGGRGPQFILSNVDARRYSVMFNGEAKGAVDFLTDSKACVQLATTQSRPQRSFETDIPGVDANWKEVPINKKLLGFEKQSIGAFVDELLDEYAGRMTGGDDGPPEIKVSLTTPDTGYARRIFVHLEMHGRLPNRVKGMRGVIDIQKDGSEWQVKKMFAQFMHRRGPFAGQWRAPEPTR